MKKKNISDFDFQRVMDNTLLSEIFHPDNENIEANFSLAYAKLLPGEVSLKHRLQSSIELYFILNGKGLMHIDDEAEEVFEKDLIFIPVGAEQFIENLSNENELEFLCIVSPKWNKEDEGLV